MYLSSPHTHPPTHSQHLMQLRLLVQAEYQGRQRLLSLRRTPSTDESIDISSFTAPVIHFVETAPSVLREMPWIQLKEHKVWCDDVIG